MSPESGQGSTVDVDWIAAHLGEPGVRLVEIDVSRAAYDEGHIPGAVLWNAYTDLRDPNYKPAGLADLERLLSRSGITPETCVVTYGYSAPLGFWLLRAHGHEDVRMLMGAREQWAQLGHEWSTDAPAIAESAHPPVVADDAPPPPPEQAVAARARQPSSAATTAGLAPFRGESMGNASLPNRPRCRAGASKP